MADTKLITLNINVVRGHSYKNYMYSTRKNIKFVNTKFPDLHSSEINTRAPNGCIALYINVTFCHEHVQRAWSKGL